MKSHVSVRSISGAKFNGMKYHVKGCIADISPDRIIIHQGTNELKDKNNLAENIAKNIIDHAESLKSKVSEVFISSLVIRNDHLNKKRQEVNEILKKKCKENNTPYIDNDNITSAMLTSKGLHLNDNGTVRLVNNFCNSVSK